MINILSEKRNLKDDESKMQQFKLNTIQSKYCLFFACHSSKDYDNLIIELVGFDYDVIYLDNYDIIVFTGQNKLELDLIKEKFVNEIWDTSLISGEFKPIEKLDYDILKDDIMINYLSNYGFS